MRIYHQPSLLPDSAVFGFHDRSYTDIVDSFSTAASFSFTNMREMLIHQKIRAGREALKMNVQAFADALGVTRAAVNQWEKEGGTAPSRKHQPAVARLIGISVADLMAESVEVKPPVVLATPAPAAIKEVADPFRTLRAILEDVPEPYRVRAMHSALLALAEWIDPETAIAKRERLVAEETPSSEHRIAPIKSRTPAT